MNLNPPKRIRAALYLLTALGTPVAAYLKAKGYIGDLELSLWGSEITVVALMAGINTGSNEETPAPPQ